MKIPTKTTFLLLLPLLVISCGNEKPSPDSNQPTPPHIHAPSSTYAKDETGHYHPLHLRKRRSLRLRPS